MVLQIIAVLIGKPVGLDKVGAMQAFVQAQIFWENQITLRTAKVVFHHEKKVEMY